MLDIVEALRRLVERYPWASGLTFLGIVAATIKYLLGQLFVDALGDVLFSALGKWLGVTDVGTLTTALSYLIPLLISGLILWVVYLAGRSKASGGGDTVRATMIVRDPPPRTPAAEPSTATHAHQTDLLSPLRKFSPATYALMSRHDRERKAAVARRDVRFSEAVHYLVENRWPTAGESLIQRPDGPRSQEWLDRTTGSEIWKRVQRAAAQLRQAARDGDIRSWGYDNLRKLRLDSVLLGAETDERTYEPIPAAHWKDYHVDLDGFLISEAVAWTTKGLIFDDGSFGNVMYSRVEVERVLGQREKADVPR